MLGAWEGDEELLATAWTAAGKARGTISVHAGPGGGLILDYAEDRDGATMTGHGVVFGAGWWSCGAATPGEMPGPGNAANRDR